MRDKQNKRRIAITGIGLVTPLGNTAEQTWAASLSGKSGIAEIESFDARGFPTRIAAEVKDFDAARSTSDRKILKYAGRFNRFALAAAEEAIADCGISPTSSDSKRDRKSTL